MATGLYNTGRILSATASNAFTENTFGKSIAGDLVTPCTVKGERPDFIFQDGDDAGKPASLGTPPGVYKVVAGEALDDNEAVIVGANARAYSAAESGAEGDWQVGKVSRGTSASAAGQIVVIEFWSVPMQITPAP